MGAVGGPMADMGRTLYSRDMYQTERMDAQERQAIEDLRRRFASDEEFQQAKEALSARYPHAEQEGMDVRWRQGQLTDPERMKELRERAGPGFPFLKDPQLQQLAGEVGLGVEDWMRPGETPKGLIPSKGAAGMLAPIEGLQQPSAEMGPPGLPDRDIASPSRSRVEMGPIQVDASAGDLGMTSPLQEQLGGLQQAGREAITAEHLHGQDLRLGEDEARTRQQFDILYNPETGLNAQRVRADTDLEIEMIQRMHPVQLENLKKELKAKWNIEFDLTKDNWEEISKQIRYRAWANDPKSRFGEIVQVQDAGGTPKWMNLTWDERTGLPNYTPVDLPDGYQPYVDMGAAMRMIQMFAPDVFDRIMTRGPQENVDPTSWSSVLGLTEDEDQAILEDQVIPTEGLTEYTDPNITMSGHEPSYDEAFPSDVRLIQEARNFVPDDTRVRQRDRGSPQRMSDATQYRDMIDKIDEEIRSLSIRVDPTTPRRASRGQGLLLDPSSEEAKRITQSIKDLEVLRLQLEAQMGGGQ